MIKPDRIRESPEEYGAPRQRLSATEAARNFSEVLNRVKYRGESFLIERAGEVICEIRPATSRTLTGTHFVTLLRSLPPVDDDYLDTVEALTRNQPSVPESTWEP